MNYYTNDVLVTDKECLYYNIQCSICHHRIMNSSDIEIYWRHGHKIPHNSEIEWQVILITCLRTTSQRGGYSWNVFASPFRMPPLSIWAYLLRDSPPPSHTQENREEPLAKFWSQGLGAGINPTQTCKLGGDV